MSDDGGIEWYETLGRQEQEALEDEFAEWLINGNAKGLICNGDMLVCEMEDSDNWDRFLMEKANERLSTTE